MASYPASVKTFTSKNAGDVVQAAHINDLQDEVNAIEAGLLNGTAPLNSSNSTFASAAVTGTFNAKGAFQLNGSAGSSGQVLASNGGSSGASWITSPGGAIPTVLAKSTNYAVLATDGTDYGGVTIEFTGTGLSTITLFALASTSAGRRVFVKNMSTQSTSILTVDGNSTQLIDSTLTFTLNVEDAATFQANSDGTKWLVF